jgi:hypothetical protein
MKKIKIIRFCTFIIAITFLMPVLSHAQCENAPLPNYSAQLGATNNFDECPAKIPALGGVMVYITINGKEICDYTYKNKTNPNVIYWPKDVPMNWGFFAIGEDDHKAFNYCDHYAFFQGGPSGQYTNSPGPLVFNPSGEGLYQLGGSVVLKMGKPILIKIKKFPWIKRDVERCASSPPRSVSEVLFFNVCVIDIGSSGTITPGVCGENILKRPENTATYTYYWQKDCNGMDMSNGAATISTTYSGTYYLRARHNATGMWGKCISYNAVVVATPPVPTVNINNCGNVTLTMPQAPSGVTYYWQGSSCDNPGSTANQANIPYPVSSIGNTYYVKAYDGSCWSACSQVTTPTVSAVQPPLVADVYACACDLDPTCGDPYEFNFHADISPPATTCRWWSGPFGSNLLYVGTDYPATAFGNTTFYVSAYNSTSGCESMRIPVKITFKSCEKCLDAFSPIPGKEYIISAWVKEKNGFNAPTYSNAFISIDFEKAIPSTAMEFRASGEIIEGWQKIEKRFTIPANTEALKIGLNNGGSNADVFFDDIRIFPFNGNMISYVYDPITLKLVAELDANNYSTYYIYDDEGNLNSIRKETTQGIKTIKEGRANNVINNSDGCN